MTSRLPPLTRHLVTRSASQSVRARPASRLRSSLPRRITPTHGSRPPAGLPRLRPILYEERLAEYERVLQECARAEANGELTPGERPAVEALCAETSSLPRRSAYRRRSRLTMAVLVVAREDDVHTRAVVQHVEGSGAADVVADLSEFPQAADLDVRYSCCGERELTLTLRGAAMAWPTSVRPGGVVPSSRSSAVTSSPRPTVSSPPTNSPRHWLVSGTHWTCSGSTTRQPTTSRTARSSN